MKIGTVTFLEENDNYGCILQCYALVAFLKARGHDVFFIKNRYVEEKRSFWQKIRWLCVSLMMRPIETISEIYNDNWSKVRKQNYTTSIEHDRCFKQFMLDNIPTTEKIYNQHELIKTPPQADAYICGSDQIWGGTNPTMYLKFSPKGALKIAYAASFGGLCPQEPVLKIIKDYIKDFDVITIRERSGVELCRSKLGRGDAEFVVDPTLLLNSIQYDVLKKSSIQEKRRPYVFLYLLGNKMSVSVEEIYEFAKKNGYVVKYVASGGRVDDYPKIYPTVEQWIDLLSNANYVITNSFHGTVFSLLYKKKFLTLPLIQEYKRMNDRILDLLEPCNLGKRIYKEQLEEIIPDIDFSGFEKYREREIKKVDNFLSMVGI